MSKGFNWTKIAKQDQMRKNGTQEVEAMADALLGKKKQKNKSKFGKVGKVWSKPKDPIVFEWNPDRST
jgi:hypothetical protein|tara:strand:+ start:267 stop:470 length:204 start_codon:yes stop_codon:yes gene_type:complete